MKKQLFILLFSFVGLFGFPGFNAPGSLQVSNLQESSSVRHVVFIDLNDQATDSVLENLERDLQELKEKIPQIKTMEWGVNIQEGADYSHCLMMIFDDPESLAQYEEHPDHLEFAATYGPYVNKMTEVDYWR